MDAFALSPNVLMAQEYVSIASVKEDESVNSYWYVVQQTGH